MTIKGWLTYAEGVSFRHQRSRERVFIAGALEDLPAIESLLSMSGPDAYGQVYIEIGDESDVRPVSAPGRVTVTWLPRANRSGRVRPTLLSRRGEALAEAIDGWVAEWMPEDADREDVCLMWLGCADSSFVTALYDRLYAHLGNVHALPEYQ